MATNIIDGGFKRQDVGEGTCKEDDGCPTEKAVLQRFWREHHKQAATEAAKATGTACVTCNGTGLVDDGEINHYQNGKPYMCGPVKCVKDCPDCTPAARQPAPVVSDIETALRNLVEALDGAFISSWQSTHAWQDQLDAARNILDRSQP